MLLHGSLPMDSTDILWESAGNLRWPRVTQVFLVLLHLPEMSRQQDNKNIVYLPIQMVMDSTTNRSEPIRAGVHTWCEATEATAELGSAMMTPRWWEFLCEEASMQGGRTKAEPGWARPRSGWRGAEGSPRREKLGVRNVRLQQQQHEFWDLG